MMNNGLRERAKQLAIQPYTIRILADNSVDNEPLYLALNPELEGCVAQGETPEEAVANLNEFRIDYLEHLLEHGLRVPEPASTATITAGTPDPARFGEPARFTLMSNLDLRAQVNSLDDSQEQADPLNSAAWQTTIEFST